MAMNTVMMNDVRMMKQFNNARKDEKERRSDASPRIPRDNEDEVPQQKAKPEDDDKIKTLAQAFPNFGHVLDIKDDSASLTKATSESETQKCNVQSSLATSTCSSIDQSSKQSKETGLLKDDEFSKHQDVLAQNRKTAKVRRDRKREYLRRLQDLDNELRRNQCILSQNNAFFKHHHTNLVAIVNHFLKNPITSNLSSINFQQNQDLNTLLSSTLQDHSNLQLSSDSNHAGTMPLSSTYTSSNQVWQQQQDRDRQVQQLQQLQPDQQTVAQMLAQNFLDNDATVAAATSSSDRPVSNTSLHDSMSTSSMLTQLISQQQNVSTLMQNPWFENLTLPSTTANIDSSLEQRTNQNANYLQIDAIDRSSESLHFSRNAIDLLSILHTNQATDGQEEENLGPDSKISEL